jgi:hypothetical protein
MNELMIKKAELWLSKLVRSEFGIITREELYKKYDLIGKITETKIYSDKKINLEYKKLKNPKKIYMLVFLENKNIIYYEVPKIVYDYYICVELSKKEILEIETKLTENEQ